jgi:hypothetical protein
LLRLQAVDAFPPGAGIELECLAIHLEMLRLVLERAQGCGVGRELCLEILTLERQVSYLRLDLFDLLLPVLKDEQLLQFHLHARMLWAERSAVNRRRVKGGGDLQIAGDCQAHEQKGRNATARLCSGKKIESLTANETRTVAVIKSGHALQRAEGGHGIEVVLRVDDVWPENEVFQISRHRHRIALEQTFALAEIAAISQARMTARLQAARQVPNEHFRAPAQVKAVIRDEHSHAFLRGLESASPG